ncbi:EAL domain-containing protein [Alkalihalobacillus sp. MEB130]|uniref:EAL domain-containing protein n=1 Tax=Alkalihalobacillus sp. MEB130 TaxID=2976704 RepID=UPI0028DFC48F|nr:EAL domain-containing protein [Alkalihalobacillus sp. MEB130]MDT8858655.1 EAL domain-containing protein [Alkalihalobacillus sp. MEB130]
MNNLLNRKQRELQAINKESLFKDLFLAYPEALFLLNSSGEFIDLNEGLVNLLGITKDRLLHTHFSNYIDKDDVLHVQSYFTNALQGRTQEREFKVIHESGNSKYVSVTVVPAKIKGEILGVYGVAKDITEKKELETALRRSEVRFESLIDKSTDVIAILDHLGMIKYESPAVKHVLGYDPCELYGMNVFELIDQEDLRLAQNLFYAALNQSSETHTSELRIKKADGGVTYCEVYVTNLLEDENVNGIVVNYRDISSRKAQEEEIKQMAFHDYLTGLPNRFMLEKKLLDEIIENKNTAVLFIDLDRFKVINDNMGHHVGDLLLKEVTIRLKSCLSEQDLLFRQGGDEFIILLTNATREVATSVATTIIQSISYPFVINNYDIFTSPSIGISMFPDDGQTVEQLTRNADFAMYQAKKMGRNTFCSYAPPEFNTLNPLSVEMDLHAALEREELELHYQPKVSLKTGKVIGVEALMRWNHPKWGMVSPATFIPIAEETGLIVAIGEWALKTACQKNKQLLHQGLEIVMSVNLSQRQFQKIDLVATVANILKETELKAELLELEITESMTANIDQTIATLHELKRLGVKISIDDFGTGFSSLNYLKQFPIDTLKIDQSFVRELSDQDGETIVKTIISMAHNLKLNVVAEGIETKEQLIFLQQHLCNEGQGYFFSKPVPEGDLISFITNIQENAKALEITVQDNERLWTEEFKGIAELEKRETLALEMVFKFKKVNGTFIHTFCEGELLHHLGRSPSDIIGKELKDFLSFDLANEKVCYYDRAWQGEEVSYKGMINGFYYLANLQPVISCGEVIEVIGSCINLKDLHEQERVALSVGQRQTKSEKIEVAGELAAGIAHEIRNPITSIKGFIQLFEQGIMKKDYFDVIHSSFYQIEEVLKDFLMISKSELNETQLVDISGLIQDALAEVNPGNEIEIISHYDKEIPNILCDSVKIKEVLVQVLTNSTEAIKRTGTVKIEVKQDQSNLLILIEDDGIGMTRERVDRLGEPFFSNKEKGIGLGLMMCYHIIWLHNGSIQVKSAESEGTQVEIRIPFIGTEV